MTQQENTEAFLAHHGIKGMKWGIRREDPGGSQSSNKTTTFSKQEKSILKFAQKNGLSAQQMLNKHEPELSERLTKKAETLEARAASAKRKGQDVKENGFDAQSIKDMVGGSQAAYAGKNSSDFAFRLTYGMSKQKFLDTHVKAYDEQQKRSESDAKAVREGRLTKNQKILVGVGAVAVVAGLAYYGNKKLGPGDVPLSQKGKAFMWSYNNTKMAQSKGLTPEGVARLGKEDLNFDPGHVFRRVSMAQEQDVRPDGFFAASNDSDLERYKAILPVYWKMWPNDGTVDPSQGHVISLSSTQAIKAPAPKKVYDYFREQLEKDPDISIWLEDPFKPAQYKDLDEKARKLWPQYVLGMANKDLPNTNKLFTHFKAQGYNAFVDSNDAGVLADSPMRLIDGSIFKITGTEPLLPSAIKTAQDKISQEVIKKAA